MIRTMAKQTTEPVVANNPTTVAELRLASAALNTHDRTLMEEAAAIYKAMKTGSPQSFQMSEHQRRVASHVQSLTGATPQHLLVPAVSRDDEIRAQRDAIALVQRDFGRKIELALHRDAEKWVLENATAWRALCRKIVLAAAQLEALEQRAREFLEPISGSHVGGVAMVTTIGRRSLLGIGGPLQEMQTNALEEGIVTASELKKAADV
jgi:hypothetical protein